MKTQQDVIDEMDVLGFCFWIDHKFPSLNQAIAAAKKHWASYAKMKKDETDFVVNVIKLYDDPKRKRVPMFDHIDLELYFHEKQKGRLRDWDNIVWAQKFILDGMVAAGIIKDDSPLYINSVQSRVIYTDAYSVYVEVVGYNNQ